MSTLCQHWVNTDGKMINNNNWLVKLRSTLKILSFQEWGVPVQVRPRAPNLLSVSFIESIFPRPFEGLAAWLFLLSIIYFIKNCIILVCLGWPQMVTKSLRVSTLCQQTLKIDFRDKFIIQSIDSGKCLVANYLINYPSGSFRKIKSIKS